VVNKYIFMKKINLILLVLFVLSFILTVIGAYMKILYYPFDNVIITISLLLYFVVIVGFIANNFSKIKKLFA